MPVVLRCAFTHRALRQLPLSVPTPVDILILVFGRRRNCPILAFTSVQSGSCLDGSSRPQDEFIGGYLRILAKADEGIIDGDST